MFQKTEVNLIGLISDTHGLLRAEALEALKGVDLILHAGDIGDPQVIEDLSCIAPVIAVRGNIDNGRWADTLPDRETVKAKNVSIYILHNLKELDLNPQAAGFQVVVSGHSHKPVVKREKNVLYINPGSAGRRRFKLPITVAHLKIDGDEIEAEIIDLEAPRWD